MNRIKNMNEVMTGLFLISVAILAFYLAAPLSTITEVGLGPGYVPKMFAIIQLVLGGALVISGFVTVGEKSEAWQMRPMVLTLASIAFFAMSIERMGLVVAISGLVLISCAANKGTTFKEALALAVGSVVVSSLVFVKLLGLSIAIWPPVLIGS